MTLNPADTNSRFIRQQSEVINMDQVKLAFAPEINIKSPNEINQFSGAVTKNVSSGGQIVLNSQSTAILVPKVNIL